MPLNFVPQRGAAVDRETGLTIYAPRMLPAEGQDDVEYQYSFDRNDHSIDGLGLYGFELSVRRNGRVQQVFTLDLGREAVLESIFNRVKKSFANEDDDFSFLANLAQGLISVFESRTDNDDDVRYVAITKPSLLSQHGIELPEEFKNIADDISLPDGYVAIAEITVPAHPVQAGLQ